MLPSSFIRAGEKPNRYDNFVPAPVFIKKFNMDILPSAALFTIGTPGFYRLFVNGKEVTKGVFAPYISNPDHILYYDRYEIADCLIKGENIITVLAGNGNCSSPGGAVWDFDLFPWTDAAKVAFCLESGDEIIFESDESTDCCDSYIYFDDLRSGERADGRKLGESFPLPSENSMITRKAIKADCPKGDKKICEAHPVGYTGNDYTGKYLGKMPVCDKYKPHRNAFGAGKPVPQEDFMKGDADVWDFGINTAAIPRFEIHGANPGQRLEFQFAEFINLDGEISYTNIDFYPDGYSQRDVYICRGGETEVYSPSFTYHGARYCAVYGLEEGKEQILEITFRQISTIRERYADFTCSDENANMLFDICVNSDVSNFVYFPTDCPQREKNGWTGDAANSSDRMSMFYDVYDDFREWMHNVRKAVREDGLLPGIVPTNDWGYEFRPSWDKVISLVPENARKFSGRNEIASENLEAIFAYIKTISDRLDKYGMVERDHGDWLCPDEWKRAHPKICGTASACVIFDFAEKLFAENGKTEYLEFTKNLRKTMVEALREHFVNTVTCTCGFGQSAQSLAIMRGFFTEEEKPLAYKRFLEAIENDGGHLCFGLQGATTVIPLLFESGDCDLAWNMIMREDFPSYAHFLKQGCTSLPESFFNDNLSNIDSLNHHMFGFIALCFVKYVAGINAEYGKVDIHPCYVENLGFAQAKYSTDDGEIIFRWERDANGNIKNMLSVPEGFEFTTTGIEGEIEISYTEKTSERKGYPLFNILG